MIVKPMLAATVKDVNQLRFPLLASAKIDGIRAFTRGGKLLSRTGKPIPNNHIRQTLEAILPDGMDGELVVGNNYQETNSGVMTVGGKPEFTYWVFDWFKDRPFNLFCDRTKKLEEWFEEKFDFIIDNNISGVYLGDINSPRLIMLPHTKLLNLDQLTRFEQDCLAKGYEGVMLRDPNGLYKQGRSTMREQGLMKLKRFTDGEAVVIGVEELMINDNPQTTSELGYAKRSSHQENKRPGNMLGALVVRDLKTGVEFNIGTGFTEQDRKRMWKGVKAIANISPGSEVIGLICKYKSFHIGVKDKPRHPVFLGFRSKEDM